LRGFSVNLWFGDNDVVLARESRGSCRLLIPIPQMEEEREEEVAESTVSLASWHDSLGRQTRAS